MSEDVLSENGANDATRIVNNENEKPPSFRIIGHTTMSDPINPKEGIFNVFIVEIEFKKKRWKILRRYRDFDQLHHQLLRHYPHLPPFPPKKYKRTQTPDFIEKRKQELADYIQSLHKFAVDESETKPSPKLHTGDAESKPASVPTSPKIASPTSPNSSNRGSISFAEEITLASISSDDFPKCFHKKPEFWAIMNRFLELGNNLVSSMLSEGFAVHENNASIPKTDSYASKMMEFSVPRSRPSASYNAADSCYFQVLKSKFPTLFNSIVEKNCILLLPRQFIPESGRKYITKDIYETHAIFQIEDGEKYTTLDHRTVVMDGSNITTSSEMMLDSLLHQIDFPLELSRAILSEELIYDENSRSLRVICIEGPIEPKAEFQALIQRYTEEEVVFPESHSLDDYAGFLKSYPENRGSLRQTLYHMYQFNEGHGGAGDSISISTAQKNIWQIINKTYQELVKVNVKFATCGKDTELKNALLQIIANFVVGGCSQKIQMIIHTECAKKDFEIAQSFAKLQFVSYEKLGVRDEFRIPCSDTIAELGNLSHCQTPMEKLACIRSASAKIIHEIDDYQQKSPDESEVLAVATDDMLSLFVYSLIKAKPKSVQSDIAFIDSFFINFGLNNQLIRDLEFYFANFQAAIAYISQDAEAHLLAESAEVEHDGSSGTSRSRRQSYSASASLPTPPPTLRRKPNQETSGNRVRKLKELADAAPKQPVRIVQFSESNDLSELLDSAPPALQTQGLSRIAGHIFSFMVTLPVTKHDHPLAPTTLDELSKDTDDEEDDN